MRYIIKIKAIGENAAESREFVSGHPLTKAPRSIEGPLAPMALTELDDSVVAVVDERPDENKGLLLTPTPPPKMTATKVTRIAIVYSSLLVDRICSRFSTRYA